MCHVCSAPKTLGDIYNGTSSKVDHVLTNDNCGLKILSRTLQRFDKRHIQYDDINYNIYAVKNGQFTRLL